MRSPTIKLESIDLYEVILLKIEKSDLAKVTNAIFFSVPSNFFLTDNEIPEFYFPIIFINLIN